MGINTDLTRIKNAKSALKTAINAKGGTITDGKLDTYAAQVNSILTGIDTSDATAVNTDILSPKTAYVNGAKVTGTMANQGTKSTDISAKATEVTIAQGYHSGSGKVKISATEQAKITADNIKKDVSILGVTGSLESGGGGSPALDGLPSDWPDIHAIVESDVQSGYSYKYIYLLADDYTYLNLTKTGNAVAFKTSDGSFYTATTTHNWNTALDFDCSEGYKTRWVIVYTNTENITVSLPYEVLWLDMYSTKGSNGGYGGLEKLRAIDGLFQTRLTNMSYMFSDCFSLTRVPDVLDTSSAEDLSSMFYNCFSLTRVPDVLDTSSAEDLSSMFYNCFSLTRVPDVLDTSSATDMSSMFNSCSSLTRVPDVLDTSSATNMSYMFYFCSSLIRVPDVLDTSSATNMSYMFYFCSSLTRVPSLTIATGSVAAVAPNFEQSTRVNAENRDSVAIFSGSTVTGGLVGNLPSVTATRRLTLNSTIKSLFTPTEQGYIASNLTSKNWTLTW